MGEQACIASPQSCHYADAEATTAAQLPQVMEKDGACGAQIGACSGNYPCCSAEGKCGCTNAACSKQCQPDYGRCILSTPDADWSIATANGTLSSVGDTPSNSDSIATSACSDPWIMSAIEENNKLRAQAGADPLECNESASDLAQEWSRDMCKYEPRSCSCQCVLRRS